MDHLILLVKENQWVQLVLGGLLALIGIPLLIRLLTGNFGRVFWGGSIGSSGADEDKDYPDSHTPDYLNR